MSAGLSEASELGTAIFGPGPLPPYAVAATTATAYPVDPVLAGMVAAGQGIQAICLYLGLTRAALDDHLARLALRLPHDRALRNPGPRGWSNLDTQRLIVCRVGSIHPETIGRRVCRSANAVRAKARRLGIPRPDRKSLQRVDPASLEDPAPLFAGSGQTGSPESSLKSPCAPCGTAAGPVSVRTGADTSAAVTVLPPESETTAPAVARLPCDGAAQRLRELEFPIVAHACPSLPLHERPGPGFVPVPPQIWPLVVELEPRIKAEVKLADVVPKLAYIGWVGETRHILRDAAAVLVLSLRYFGGQHWKWIAQDARMHKPQLASDLTRIRLPRDFDRWKFRKTFNLECALYSLLESGYLLRRNKERGNYEWVNARDLRNVHQSWETRRKWGHDEGDGRRRESPKINLLTPRELPALRPQTPAPLVSGHPKASVAGTVTGYGVQARQVALMSLG
jgi:hypothetical protein